MDQPPSEPTAQAVEGQDPAPTMPATTTQTRSSSSAAPTTPSKPVHSLVLDANAIIKNEPAVSTLISQAEELYTIPAVVTESASGTLTAGFPLSADFFSSSR